MVWQREVVQAGEVAQLGADNVMHAAVPRYYSTCGTSEDVCIERGGSALCRTGPFQASEEPTGAVGLMTFSQPNRSSVMEV
jgi:hypothetical protein